MFKKGSLIALVNRLYTTWGLNTIVSNMIGYKVEITGICLHYSDEHDVHFTQVMGDTNYNNKLMLLHRDPKPNIKSLLYLKEVTTNDGPFKWIPYSHRLTTPWETRMASQANCTHNYLDTPANRDMFLSLPDNERQTSIFGSITDDDDPLSYEMLSQEKEFLSEDGNIILFAASGIAHRGGSCNKGGTRATLQITFGAI